DRAATACPGIHRAAAARVRARAGRGEGIDGKEDGMKAAVFHGERRISIADLAPPTPAAGEVRLRVRRTALCGSDAKLWIKGAEHTPGHEIFGVVRQAGHRLDGKRCLVYIPVHCGKCEACRAGDTHMCLVESVLV